MGNDTITANYSGDSNHNAGTVTASQTVNQASQTITVSVPAPPTAVNKTSFTVVATGGGSGNPVLFTSSGACTNVLGTYTMNSTKIGAVCTVTMNQAGNVELQGCTASRRDHQDSGGDCADGERKRAGQHSVSVDLHGGSHHERQHDPDHHGGTGHGLHDQRDHGDDGERNWDVYGNSEVGSGRRIQGGHVDTGKTTASKLASVITWASPSPITYGTTLSGVLDATANVAGKFAYKANGTAVTATKVLAVGSYTLTATFTPTASTDYATATATVGLVVNQAATTTTITTTSPNPSVVNKAVKVSFTVAPGKPTGSVTVTASTGETCSGNADERQREAARSRSRRRELGR